MKVIVNLISYHLYLLIHLHFMKVVLLEHQTRKLMEVRLRK